MGIFNFFKKKEPIEEKEVLYLENLSKWIIERKEQHQTKEQEFFNPIKQRISQLISELEEEISILENFDLESKKVENKIKLIIKENLRNYLSYLEKLIEKLKEIRGKERIIERINSLFEDFEKRSRMSYEKVTFLIGKEMQATKESIRKFLRDLENILKDNSKLFKEFEIIGFLEENFSKIKGLEKEKGELLKEKGASLEKVRDLNEIIQEKNNEIKIILNSEKYLKEKEKRKKLGSKEQELEKEIINLKQLIDFKDLSSFYHKFEKERKLVKDYKEFFREKILNSEEGGLIKLLDEAKLNNSQILELIKKINFNKKQISDCFISDLGINDLKKGIEKIESEINLIESEKIVKEKRLETLNQDLEKRFNEIKENLEEIGIEIKK